VAELKAGTAFVDLVPRLGPGSQAMVGAQMGGVFSGLAGKAKIAGLAVGAGLAAGAVAGGVALYRLGDTFSDFRDTIQVGTGATGDALDDLIKSFKNVATEVPNDMGQTAQALADLNTRTGLSGEALENLTERFLTMSRITKTDVGTNIREVTRMFGDWGVSTDDQADRLDFLYRVSQTTGIGVDRLSGQMVKFGAPLRQLGFSLEESATLLGNFEREGVNAELVMGSMRIALGKMARDGEPAQETLARVTDEIANAGSASEANALALELFGARAGPDMAAAIREGRFEVGELVAELTDGENTIAGAAENIDRGLGETFGRIRNKVAVALEPIATQFVGFVEEKVLPVVEDFFDRLPEMIEAVSEFLDPLIGGFQQVFGILFGDEDNGGPFAKDSDFIIALWTLRDLFVDELLPVAREVFGWLQDNAKPILIALGAALALLISPIGAVVAALVAAYFRFEGFRNVVDAIVRFLVEKVVPWVVEFAGKVGDTIGDLADWWRDNWDDIRATVETVVEIVSNVISAGVDAVLLVWSYFGDTILAVFENAWNNIYAVLEFAVALVKGIIEGAMALIRGDWQAAWDAIVGVFSAAWDLVKELVSNAFEVVKTFIGDGLNAAQDLVELGVEKIVEFFSKLPGRLLDAAGDLFSFVWESFKAALNLVIRAWNSLEFEIPGFSLGPVSFDGFTLGVPDIPELADGGRSVRSGLALVGEEGPELLSLNAGASVVPLDVAAMIAGAAEGPSGAGVFRDLVVPTTADSPEEIAETVNSVVGWKIGKTK